MFQADAWEPFQVELEASTREAAAVAQRFQRAQRSTELARKAAVVLAAVVLAGGPLMAWRRTERNTVAGVICLVAALGVTVGWLALSRETRRRARPLLQPTFHGRACRMALHLAGHRILDAALSNRLAGGGVDPREVWILLHCQMVGASLPTLLALVRLNEIDPEFCRWACMQPELVSKISGLPAAQLATISALYTDWAGAPDTLISTAAAVLA